MSPPDRRIDVAEPPPFDPSKPFTTTSSPPSSTARVSGGAAPPSFDPSKPYDIAGQVKVYYNDAGQPFTVSGAPVPTPPKPDESYTGSILPLSRDASGLHLAIPEAIMSPIRGAIEGGKRLLGVGEEGKNPLRPLSPDTLSAVSMFADMAPGVGENVTKPAPAAIAGVTPERAQLAQQARDVYGIPVTAPQIGMSRGGKFMESASRSLPLSGAREHELATRQAWNRAISKTFGEDATEITPSIMAAAKKRLGGEINRIENSNTVNLDQNTVTKLAAIEATAFSSLTDAEFTVVKRQIDNVLRHVTSADELAGTTVGALLHKGGPLERATASGDPNIAHTAQAIKILVQEALQNSLPPEEAEAYRNARFQYKNMKTVEPLVNKSPTGDISPALLNSRVSQQFPNRAYDTKGHDLDSLAKIGQAFLKEPGSSGTAERGAVMYSGAELARLMAALFGGEMSGLGLAHTLSGVGGAMLAGRGAGSLLRSPWMARRAIKNVLNPPLRMPSSEFPWLLPTAAFGAQATAEGNRE